MLCKIAELNISIELSDIPTIGERFCVWSEKGIVIDCSVRSVRKERDFFITSTGEIKEQEERHVTLSVQVHELDESEVNALPELIAA